MGEIKRPKCRNVWNSWIGRPNTLKILILVQLIYKINAILAKIPQDFFFSNTILIFIWKLKETTRGRGRRQNLKDLHDSKGDLFESHSNPSTLLVPKFKKKRNRESENRPTHLRTPDWWPRKDEKAAGNNNCVITHGKLTIGPRVTAMEVDSKLTHPGIEISGGF